MNNKGVLVGNFQGSIALDLYKALYKSKDKRQCSYVFLNTLKKSIGCKNVLLVERMGKEEWITLADGRLKIQKRKIELSEVESTFSKNESYKLIEWDKDSIKTDFLYLISLDQDHLVIIEHNKELQAELISKIIEPVKAFYDYSLLLSDTTDDNHRASDGNNGDDLISQMITDLAKNETPMGLLGLDNEYNIKELNKAGARITQFLFNKKLSIGDNLRSFYTAKDFKEFESDVISKLRKGELIEKVISIESESKTIKLQASYKALVDKSNQVKGFLFLLTDVSELEKAKLYAQENRQILKSILEFSESSYTAYGKDSKLIFFNAGAKQSHKDAFGIDLRLGMHISEISQHESSFWHNRSIEDFLNGKDEKNRQIRYEKNGETRIVNLFIVPLKGEEGEVLGWMENSIDVTEETLKNQVLSRREATLEAILNSSINGIYAVDRNMILLAVNKKAKRDFVEYCGQEVSVGTDLHKVIPKEDLERWKNEYFNKVFNGEELSYLGPIGDSRVVENMYHPVVNEKNEIVACLEVSRDITDSVSKQQELVKSEKRFRSLVENLPTGIIRTSIDGIINDASAAIEQIIGYSNVELIGKHISGFIHEDDRAELGDYMTKLSKEENTLLGSTKVINKNKEIRSIEGRASIIKDEEDSPQEYLFTFNDVTEQLKIEKKLASAKGNYELLFKNMYDAVLLYNFDTEEILDYNVAFAKFYGQEKRKIKALDWDTFIPKTSNYIPGVDLWENFKGLVERVSRKETITTRGVLYNKDKEEKLAEVSMFPALESGNIAYIVIKDITDSYRNAQDSKDKTSIYEQLIEQSSEGIDIIEIDQTNPTESQEDRIVVRNELMSSYLGSADKPITRMEEVLSIMSKDQPNDLSSDELVKDVHKSIFSKKKMFNEVRIVQGNKTFDINVSHNLVELRDKKYLIRNFLDVTEKKKSEDIIRQQILDLNLKNNELQKYIDSNLQLENFAYIASHDLKAPIRSVISFMQLLKKNVESQLDEKNLKFIDIVLTASTNMQVLIDDLLTYSRINTQEVEFESVDVNKLVAGLLRDLVSVVTESNAVINIDKLPTMIADSSRIRQVFQNLITNAIKFIPNDIVPEINLKYNDEKAFHHFSVSDNGIGIEQQYLDKIFLMFMKLHSENKYQGTGIGLSICKKVIDQHQGQIWVESKIGEGSTFHFRISKNLT